MKAYNTNTLLVNEIFYSIQGESLTAGEPTTFIRLTGCPLRCSYCDTSYAFKDGKELSFENIITKISSYNTSLVTVTGGEPLVRRNIDQLIRKLSTIDEIDDIAMTTNAYLLESKLDGLIDAGLNRLTVSLDSIDDKTFKKMSGQDFDVNKVLSAINQANKKGFKKIKINCVIQKNVNEHSILDLLDHFRDSGNIVTVSYTHLTLPTNREV